MNVDQAMTLMDEIQESYPFSQRVDKDVLKCWDNSVTPDPLQGVGGVIVMEYEKDQYALFANASVTLPDIFWSHRKSSKLLSNFSRDVRKNNNFALRVSGMRIELVCELSNPNTTLSRARTAIDGVAATLFSGLDFMFRKLKL